MRGWFLLLSGAAGFGLVLFFTLAQNNIIGKPPTSSRFITSITRTRSKNKHAKNDA